MIPTVIVTPRATRDLGGWSSPTAVLRGVTTVRDARDFGDRPVPHSFSDGGGRSPSRCANSGRALK